MGQNPRDGEGVWGERRGAEKKGTRGPQKQLWQEAERKRRHGLPGLTLWFW